MSGHGQLAPGAARATLPTADRAKAVSVVFTVRIVMTVLTAMLRGRRIDGCGGTRISRPKVSGTWTFTATQPTAGEVPLPFISTRVSGAFDGWGRAPAGTVFPLTLDITGHAGTVETVTVQVSYDDGGSWVGVPVSNSTGEWIARVRHPSAGAGTWVSLRVAVTDGAGNSSDWTATRSYQIANLG